MFTKKEISPNSRVSTNADNPDLPGAVPTKETSDELSRYELAMTSRIAQATNNAQLIAMETEINQFKQRLPEKSKTIWDKTLLETLHRKRNGIVDHLRMLIGEKREEWKQAVEQAKRESVGLAFSEKPEVRDAKERFLAIVPDREIAFSVLVIGGKSKDQLINELHVLHSLSPLHRYATTMLDNRRFTTARDLQPVLLVKLSGRDLGFTERPTLDELYERAQELGLEFCPAEVGPHLRLAYTNQEKGTHLGVYMEPIVNKSTGSMSIFRLDSSSYGSRELEYQSWGSQIEYWDRGLEWVFRLRV
jgi:hypothetical protein